MPKWAFAPSTLFPFWRHLDIHCTLPWLTALGLLRRQVMSRCLLTGNLIIAALLQSRYNLPSAGPIAQILFLEDTQAQPNPYLLAFKALLEHSLNLRFSWIEKSVWSRHNDQTGFRLSNTCLYLPHPHPKVPKHCQERAEDITACSQSRNIWKVLTWRVIKPALHNLRCLKNLAKTWRTAQLLSSIRIEPQGKTEVRSSLIKGLTDITNA